MSIMIDLPEHVEALLRADAAAAGTDVAVFAAERILAWYSASQSDPGKPIQQFIDEQREKHGLPETWATAKATLSADDWKAIDEAHTDVSDNRVP